MPLTLIGTDSVCTSPLSVSDDVVPPDRFLRHIDADDIDDDARGDLRARDSWSANITSAGEPVRIVSEGEEPHDG